MDYEQRYSKILGFNLMIPVMKGYDEDTGKWIKAELKENELRNESFERALKVIKDSNK